ncbi:MAG: hypothetical protein FJ280_14090 [Planctomycetes bacterium]|nr:hypothetical protein [Planctomycetota bacterium]
MRRNQGVVLALVIVALTLVGGAMFVLTIGANTMIFQADTAYLRAIERNLIASGLAWAQERVWSDAELPVAEPVELNTAVFGLPDAKLVVRILEVQSRTARVHVETTCHKGRRTLTTSRTFTVAGRAPARV